MKGTNFAIKITPQLNIFNWFSFSFLLNTISYKRLYRSYWGASVFRENKWLLKSMWQIYKCIKHSDFDLFVCLIVAKQSISPTEQQPNANKTQKTHIILSSHTFLCFDKHSFGRPADRSFNQRTISFNHFPDCPCMSAWSLLWTKRDVVELKRYIMRVYYLGH